MDVAVPYKLYTVMMVCQRAFFIFLDSSMTDCWSVVITALSLFKSTRWPRGMGLFHILTLFGRYSIENTEMYCFLDHTTF